MSHSHMWLCSETGGKCPIVIYETFQKQEENVLQLYVTLFRNGRKMSHSHIWHFSEMGGKCPLVMGYNFQKREENVHWWIVTIFWNGRKLSHNHLLCFSEMGRKCLVLVFSATGGKCPMPFKAALTNATEMGGHYPHTTHIWNRGDIVH